VKRDLLQELTWEMHIAPNFSEGRAAVFHSALDAAQAELRILLDRRASEHELQAMLEERPGLLLYALVGGFYPAATPRSALFPKVRLGEKHETDFAFVNTNSAGARWVLVEIERSHAPIFTQKGDPSADLTHALRQVTDWRTWIQDNRAYAENAFNELLRMTELHHKWGTRLQDPKYYVVIGRRAGLTEDMNRRRLTMCEQNAGLEIVTWDRLLDDYGVGFASDGDSFGEAGPGPLKELAADLDAPSSA